MKSERSGLLKVGKTLVVCALYLTSFIAIWHYSISFFAVPNFILPPPGPVLESIVNFPAYYAHQFAVTAYEAVVGAVIGFLAGLILGTFLRFGGPVSKALQPILIASQVFPKEALAPIFLLVLGFGVESKIAISALIAFFPVVVATHQGLMETPKSYVDLLTVMGGGSSARFFLVQMPYAAPFIFAALRLCVTLSVIGAVVGEFVGSSEGLGYLIRISVAEQATEKVYAALLLLGLLGGGLYVFAVALERIPFGRFTQYGSRR